MDLQEFASRYPELYEELVTRVNEFIEQHNITGDVPLVEWDDMLDLIIHDLDLDQYIASGPYAPAVTTAGPAGGSRPPATPNRPSPAPGRPSQNRPPAGNTRPPAPGGPYRPAPAPGGPAKDILRLLFLQQLLDSGY